LIDARYDEMAHNRPDGDDAGVARQILEELDRLFRWFDTKGTLYQRGVPIA
jgi:hypothetical protein